MTKIELLEVIAKAQENIETTDAYLSFETSKKLVFEMMDGNSVDPFTLSQLIKYNVVLLSTMNVDSDVYGASDYFEDNCVDTRIGSKELFFQYCDTSDEYQFEKNLAILINYACEEKQNEQFFYAESVASWFDYD